MPVTTRHPDYEKRRPQWKRCRTAIEGQDAVKAAGITYLPVLEGMEEQDVRQGLTLGSKYESYKMRAMFIEVSSRAARGLAGAVMRKDPVVHVPDQMLDSLESIGRHGESLHELLKIAVDENIDVGRAGFLVDVSAGDATDPQPYVATYKAENIVNWDATEVNDREALTMVVLREDIEVPKDGDRFERKKKEQYRVLFLGAPTLIPGLKPEDQAKLTLEEILGYYGITTDDFADGPIYFQEVWTETDDPNAREEEKYVLTEARVPKKLGDQVWHEIPFKFLNPQDTRPRPDKPPLLGVVNINLSHYRNSADQEHGTHFTALPTPWVAGFDPNSRWVIGSGVAWVTDNDQASAGMLEFTGAGLGHILALMEKKEKLMAMLAARIIESQPQSGPEAAKTVEMRHAGEQSALANISMTVSECFTCLVRWVAEWRALEETAVNDILISLNTDFNLAGLEPQQVTALMQAVLGGVMSWESFYFNMERAEMYPEGHTVEDEAALILKGPPGGVPAEQEEEEIEEEEEEEEGPRTGTAHGHDHPIEEDGSIGPGGDDGHTHTKGNDERTGPASNGDEHTHSKPQEEAQ